MLVYVHAEELWRADFSCHMCFLDNSLICLSLFGSPLRVAFVIDLQEVITGRFSTICLPACICNFCMDTTVNSIIIVIYSDLMILVLLLLIFEGVRLEQLIIIGHLDRLHSSVQPLRSVAWAIAILLRWLSSSHTSLTRLHYFAEVG